MARQQTLKRGMRIHMMEKQTWEALYALKMLYELTFLSSFWKCAICAILQVMDTQSNRHDEMGVQPNEILATVTQYPKGVRGDKDLCLGRHCLSSISSTDRFLRICFDPPLQSHLQNCLVYLLFQICKRKGMRKISVPWMATPPWWLKTSSRGFQFEIEGLDGKATSKTLGFRICW